MKHNNKNVLITGGAQRIGAHIARTLHQQGFSVFIHYANSHDQAQQLADELNAIRKSSCLIYSCDLTSSQAPTDIFRWFSQHQVNLDVLINNASGFYATPWSEANTEQWQNLFSLNCQAPFFLTQAFLKNLIKAKGSVINLIDIHAERTLENHPIYCASKAALKSLTLSLAKDHGEEIRCNGISPGAILWPEQAEDMSNENQQSILQKIPMGRLGTMDNIAQTVLYLIENDYVNGQIINVDGGRTVYS